MQDEFREQLFHAGRPNSTEMRQVEEDDRERKPKWMLKFGEIAESSDDLIDEGNWRLQKLSLIDEGNWRLQ